MAFVVKGIKPKKLKTDAIRLEILNALRAEGRDHVKEYQKTVSTWRNKVTFDYLVDVGTNDVSVLSGPSGGNAQLWKWLDEGTRPHIIVPRRARMLRFRTGYRAKTMPRKFRSGRGGADGDVVYARAVRHPGHQAREWTKTLSQRRKRPFQDRVLKATRRGTEKMF